MGIFDDIKNGVLPDTNVVFYLFKNKIVDYKNKNEIKQYIKILNNSFESANTEEKILLNRVLFILEMLIDNKDALKNFIEKAFRLNFNQTDEEYGKFFDEFFTLVEKKQLFDILNNQIIELINFSSIDLRTFFNWILHRLWNIPKYHNHHDFVVFYDNLKKLIIQLRDANRVDDMMYVEFFTYHIMGNSFQKIDEWREFNQNVTQETIKAYTQFINQLPKSNISKKKKKRIAFIKERIVFNSPFQVEYSLFKNLMENKDFRDNYELIVYSFNQFEKSDDNEKVIELLEKINIKVKKPVDYFMKDSLYNNHLQKALDFRQFLIDDEIDIMIGVGPFPIINFLYITRVAPIQIYYSHGNCAYNIPNIDKRISHFSQECKEFEWNIIQVNLVEEFLRGNEGDRIVAEIIKNDYKQKFGKDVIILGTIGRLVKIDSDEYIKTISEIMKKNSNTIYLACGSGNTENIKEKLKKYSIDEDRFIFTGQIKPHIYGWIIDIWPDSFPLWQGKSAEEFKMKGGIIIRKALDNSHFAYNLSDEIFNKVGSIENLFTTYIDYSSFSKRKGLMDIFNKIYQNKDKLSFIKLFFVIALKSEERYIEALNFFIKNPEYLQIARNLDIDTIKDFMGYESRIDINKFLRILE